MAKKDQGNRTDLDKKPGGRTFSVGRDSKITFKNARKNKVIGKTFESDLLRDSKGKVICKIDKLSGANLISSKTYSIIKEEENKFKKNVSKKLNKLK